MIDLILIQDRKTGIGLFQFKGEQVLIEPAHEDLFHGFLSAFQGIMKELNLGNITQISTDDHHFIIHREGEETGSPIDVIAMFDCEDCVDFWKDKAKQIGCDFLQMFAGDKFTGAITKYKMFGSRLLELLEVDANACVMD